jgi:hypothetical protein
MIRRSLAALVLAGSISSSISTVCQVASAETTNVDPANLAALEFKGNLKAPSRVPAGATVPGFVLSQNDRSVMPKRFLKRSGPDTTIFVGAKKVDFSGEERGKQEGLVACFDQSFESHGSEDVALEFTGSGAEHTSLQSERWDGDADTAMPANPALVRRELVRKVKDGWVLEVRDAWVDPVTRGVKLARKADVPLTLLRDLPEQMQVFAFREGDKVVALVTRPAERVNLASPMRGSTQCGHLRVPLGNGRGTDARGNDDSPQAVIEAMVDPAPEGGSRFLKAFNKSTEERTSDKAQVYRLAVARWKMAGEAREFLSVSTAYAGEANFDE